MRILILSPTDPFPSDNGSKRRIAAFCRYLSGPHDVTFASLRDANSATEDDGQGTLPPCRSYRQELKSRRVRAALRSLVSSRTYRESKFASRPFQKLVNRLLREERFDVIWVNFLNMTAYLGDFERLPPPRPLLVLDQHNNDELYWKSFAQQAQKPLWRLFGRLEAYKARRLQSLWLRRFAAILSVSSEDRLATLGSAGGDTPVWLAPNGVDVDYFAFRPPPSSSEQGKTVICFGGSMDVAMNQDAAKWFAESVFPLVRRRLPEAEFWVVGKDPPRSLRRLADVDAVRVTGRVADVRPFYRQSSVFAVPLRLGGGTKLKTLEAMALGLPVVSTPIGVQGLEVVHGRHLFVEESAEAFADRIVQLARRRETALAVGARARRLVEERYTWSAIVDEAARKIDQLLVESRSQDCSRLARNQENSTWPPRERR